MITVGAPVEFGVPPCPVGCEQCLGVLGTVLCKCAHCQGSAQGGLKVFSPFHLLGSLMCLKFSVTHLLLILANGQGWSRLEVFLEGVFGGCSGWSTSHIYTALSS